MRENRDFGQGLIKDYLIQIFDYLQLGYCMYVFYVIYFFLVQGFINKNFNFTIGRFFNVYIIKLVWLVVGFQLYGCLCILVLWMFIFERKLVFCFLFVVFIINGWFE